MKTIANTHFLVTLVLCAVFSAFDVSADTTYDVTGFKMSDHKCIATIEVAIPGSPSVTKTYFAGSGERPDKVILKGPKSTPDAKTPNPGWSGSTAHFNGLSFSNGTWTVTLVKPHSGPPVSPCSQYDGMTVRFEHS